MWERTRRRREGAASSACGAGILRADRFYADAGLAEYFGLPWSEGASGLAREKFRMAIHEEDRGRVLAANRAAIERGLPLSERYRVCLPERETRTALAAGRCYRQGDGTPAIYSGHVFDVSGEPLPADGFAEIVGHLRQALGTAGRLRYNFVGYLVSMALMETETRAALESAPADLRTLH